MCLVTSGIVECFVQGQNEVTLVRALGRVCLLSTDLLTNIKITSYFAVRWRWYMTSKELLQLHWQAVTSSPVWTHRSNLNTQKAQDPTLNQVLNCQMQYRLASFFLSSLPWVRCLWSLVEKLPGVLPCWDTSGSRLKQEPLELDAVKQFNLVHPQMVS